jgi:hypothetical protein
VRITPSATTQTPPSAHTELNVRNYRRLAGSSHKIKLKQRLSCRPKKIIDFRRRQRRHPTSAAAADPAAAAVVADAAAGLLIYTWTRVYCATKLCVICH